MPAQLKSWFGALIVKGMPRLILALIMLSSSVSLAAQTEDRRRVGTRVVVSNLAGLGLDETVIKAFSNYLEVSLGTIPGIELISSMDLAIALEDPNNVALVECAGKARKRTLCAARTGRLVGADVVVYGTIGALADSYSVNLRAVDVRRTRSLATHAATISGSRDRLIPEVRLAAYKLVAPEKIVGSLKVEADVQGVSVSIDGVEVGATPLASTVSNLKPGRHTIALRRPGFGDLQREFQISPFETTKLKLELRPFEPVE